MKLKTIFFPGWAMPPEIKLCNNLFPEELKPVNIVDYGFFNPDIRFNFNNVENEILKFAQQEYDIVVGYSLGSQFALRLSLMMSPLPKAIIIISGFAKFTESNDNPNGQKIFALNAMITAMKIRPAQVLRDFYQLNFGDLKGLLFNKSFIPTPSKMIEGLKFLLTCDFRSEVKKIKTPSLILAGSNDTVVKPSVTEELAKYLEKSKYILIEDVGHSLPFSKDNEIRILIHDFLKEQNII